MSQISGLGATLLKLANWWATSLPRLFSAFRFTLLLWAGLLWSDGDCTGPATPNSATWLETAFSCWCNPQPQPRSWSDRQAPWISGLLPQELPIIWHRQKWTRRALNIPPCRRSQDKASFRNNYRNIVTNKNFVSQKAAVATVTSCSAKELKHTLKVQW